VAFPGGKREKGEDDYSCVIRETREEIKLDLSDQAHFACIGRLRNRSTKSMLNPVQLLVTPFVFLQLCPERIPLYPSSSEVYSAFWVPVKFFTKPVELPKEITTSAAKNVPILIRKLKFSVVYSGFLLQASEEYLAADLAIPYNSQSQNQSIPKETEHVPQQNDDGIHHHVTQIYQEPEPEQQSQHYHLWGLTLEMTIECLCLSGHLNSLVEFSMERHTPIFSFLGRQNGRNVLKPNRKSKL